VTKASSTPRARRRRAPRTGAVVRAVGLLALLAGAAPGCASLSNFTPPWKQSAATGSDTKDRVAGNANGIQKVSFDAGPQRDQLEDAKRLLAGKQYAAAEAALHAVANDRKCPETVREEALFQEAESQRLQKKYRSAESTYLLLFKDFPNTQYTERADKGMFEIAQHWLEGTRDQMRQYEEQRRGERWMVTPASFVHFTDDMPIFDTEGSAVRVLEHIRMHEINTPLGEQALMYLGTIKFFREDYAEADHYFSELYTRYPNSQHASKAIKQSIICKQLCTGGTVYDTRGVEESRKLIHRAQTAYADFAKDDEWIRKQLISINLQQADRDWRVAEFYRRTGHPGSAYFYYEIVRRNYPNTQYAKQAAERIAELERKNGPNVRPTAQPAPDMTRPVVPTPTPPPQAQSARPANPTAPRMLPPSVSGPVTP
jgi:outer membrane protein assembly factor BamD (BamD/ComL family)